MTTMSTQVRELATRWAAAEKANDAAQIAECLAEDFVGVGPVGFVLGREQWLARFANGLENRAFAVVDADVHDHGAAAVVVGVLEQQTSFAGQDNSGRFRVTLLAVAREGEWLVASVHLGPLRIPRQP